MSKRINPMFGGALSRLPTRSCLMALCSLIVCASIGSAQILFSDNFEGVSVGSSPNNGAQPGDWTNTITAGASFLHVTNAPVAPEGTQFLRIQRDAGNDIAIGGALASAMSNQEFVVSLLLQTPTSSFIDLPTAFFNSISLTMNTTDLLTTGDATAGANNVLTIWIRNSGGQRQYSWRSGTSAHTSTGLGWSVGSWDRLNLHVLPGLGASGGDAFVMSVSNLVSGTVQTTGRITFNGPTVPGSLAPLQSVTRAYFGSAAGGQALYLDDLSISIPEPTSVALLGLGGLLLLWRRK